MKSSALLIPLILLLFSCSENEEYRVQNEKNDFKFEVGQKLRYILLTGEGYREPAIPDFVYTGDTLELEVLEVDNNKYLISEKITPLSNMMVNNDDYYWGYKDSIYVNQWIIRNDSLAFETTNNTFRSHLIRKFSLTFHNRNLSLEEFDGEEVQITGWKTSYPYHENNVELYTTNYTLLGNYYDRLNVYYNNGFMATDGPGFTTVFSKEHGIIRTSEYSWWTNTGYGWDKLN